MASNFNMQQFGEYRTRFRASSLNRFMNPRGLVLVITLVLIAMLTVLGSTAVRMATTDLAIGGTYKSTQAAFYQAEAGLDYTLSQLSSLIDAGTLTLDGGQEIESHTFQTPSGFSFQIDDQDTFTRISETRKHVLRIIGRPLPGSPIRRTIEVVIQRKTALPYGVFGGAQVNLPRTGTLYSYTRRQRDGEPPIVSDQSITIGSNGVVSAQASHLPLDIKGSLTLGAQRDGTDATFTFRESSPDVESAPTTVLVGGGHQLRLLDADRLNPDPLDIDAVVETAATELSTHNNNTRITTMSDGNLTHTATLTAGRYYLKTLAPERGASLEFDARDGDIRIFTESLTLVDKINVTARTEGKGTVTIYLDGPGYFGTPSGSDQPTVATTGPPSHFRIFSRSDEPIAFYHQGDFAGLIYAPKAPVILSNSTAVGYGLLWGKTITFESDVNPFAFYVDPAIQHRFLANQMEVLSWKELRD